MSGLAYREDMDEVRARLASWSTGPSARRSKSYGAKWEYVFQNPVRAGLGADAREWKWAGKIERLSWD